jgi:hypothetical protein
MLVRKLFSFSLIACFCSFSNADTIIEFLVSEQSAPVNGAQIQPVWVKDGKLLIKGVGGSARTDVLFDQALDSLVIIDHKKRTFVPVDEEKAGRIAQQMEDAAPLIRGLNEQLGKLSAEQRTKWKEMLGDFPLGETGRGSDVPQTSIKVIGDKTVNGFACQQMDVLQGAAKTAEFCLADATSLDISGEDYATIRALLSLTGRINAKAHGLAEQFGITIPKVAASDLAGIPVEMKDFSNHNKGNMTLKRVTSETIAPESLRVPSGYRAENLTLWR